MSILLALVICSASPYATPHIELALDLRAQPPNLQSWQHSKHSIDYVKDAATQRDADPRNTTHCNSQRSAWSREMQVELAWRHDTGSMPCCGPDGAVLDKCAVDRTTATDWFLWASAGCSISLERFFRGIRVPEGSDAHQQITHFLTATRTGCGNASARALTEMVRSTCMRSSGHSTVLYVFRPGDLNRASIRLSRIGLQLLICTLRQRLWETQLLKTP